jgi:hypothetical protein
MYRSFDSEEILTLARLGELLPEWKTLWLSAQHSTRFQFPEWIVWWWRWFGAGRLRPWRCATASVSFAIVAGAVRDGTGAAEFDFSAVKSATSIFGAPKTGRRTAACCSEVH